MGHVAHGNRCIPLLGVRDRYHCWILEIVVVAAVPETAAVGLRGLEAGAVERGQLAVLVGHLRALHLDGKALTDPSDHIVEQFGVAVDALRYEVVEIVAGLVLHLIKVWIIPDLGDGVNSAYLSAPDAEDGDTKCGDYAENPSKNFFHNECKLRIIWKLC